MDLLAFAGIAVDTPPRPEARAQDSRDYKDADDNLSSRRSDDDRSSFEKALKKSESSSKQEEAAAPPEKSENATAQGGGAATESQSEDTRDDRAFLTQAVDLTREDESAATLADAAIAADSLDSEAQTSQTDEALTQEQTPLVALAASENTFAQGDGLPDKNKADGKLATPNEDGALAQNQSSTAAIADDSASNAKSGAERNADNANAKQGETDLKSRAERAINDAAIDRSAEPGPQVDSRDRAPKSINNAASQLAGLATDGGQKIAATDGANIPLAPIADSGLSTDLRLTSTRMPIEFQSALTANAQNDAARQVVAAIKTVGTQSNIDVQLDPPELGRVRISFQVDRADVVTAVVSADRADTLDIMRRNAEELTRALARAGFTDVNLNFESGNRQDEQGFAEQAAGAQSEILQDGQTAAPVVYVNVRADKVLNRLV